jgi:hypothetical protein
VPEDVADRAVLSQTTDIAPLPDDGYPPPTSLTQRIHSGDGYGTRAILSVVVGYVVMFTAIFLTFSGLYMLLGQDLSFQPGNNEPSMLWTVVSFALGIGAAVLGGYVCAWIARTATPPKVLAGVVLGIGLLSAIPVLMAAATPAETRTGEVGNLDAMMKAKQPGWVPLANPFVGLAGVLLGAGCGRLPRRDGAASPELPARPVKVTTGSLRVGDRPRGTSLMRGQTLEALAAIKAARQADWHTICSYFSQRTSRAASPGPLHIPPLLPP